MRAKFELSEADVKALILTEIQTRLGENTLNSADLKIEVKSKQNYKSEWEPAAFRAVYEGDI
jgi:hypothetical protein